jgi:ParB family chromosome partitioning protein
MEELNKKTKTDLYKIDPRAIFVVEGFNSRQDFDLDGLCSSIKENGVLNPVTVIKTKDEDGQERYRLVDGERRYRAVMRLIEEGVEIPRIPAICIPKMDDSELLIQQVVRNEGKPFNEYEYAIACQKFVQFGFTKDEIAKKIGKNNGLITYYLDHLNRDERVQELIKSGKISGSEVRRIYSGHTRKDKDGNVHVDEKAAIEEIFGAKKRAEEKGKKNITLADLDINSRTLSKRSSDTIRKGLEKLFEYYNKYSKTADGKEIDINMNLVDVLAQLKEGNTIDEIFKEAVLKTLQDMKEAV